MKESSEIFIVVAMCMVFFLTLILVVWFVTRPPPEFDLSNCKTILYYAPGIQWCEITR